MNRALSTCSLNQGWCPFSLFHDLRPKPPVTGRKLMDGALQYEKPMTVAMPAVMRILMQNTDALTTVFNHYCVRHWLFPSHL